jgi:toxin-antitoxin system PIN domain toxin
VTTYLLDVNVLLALADPAHVHHDAAHRWLVATADHAWATCPITENGFVRIASHARYPNRPGDVAAVLAILQRLCANPRHQFWSEDISIRDIITDGTVVSSAQITDIFLLGLAVHKGGKLATFDHRVAVGSVQHGAASLELIPT